MDHRRPIPLLIREAKTIEELLNEGTFGPDGDNCCAKWLTADGCGRGAPGFKCPGCKTPQLVIDAAIRLQNEQQLPQAGPKKVQLYPNW